MKAPFAFWITRRQGGDLFDTQSANIPTYASPHSSNVSSKSFAMPTGTSCLITRILQANESIFILVERTSSSGFRLNSFYTMAMQTMCTRGIGDPIDSNLCGNHPVALVHPLDGTTASTHAVIITNGWNHEQPRLQSLPSPPNQDDSLFANRTRPAQCMKAGLEERSSRTPRWWG
ncbi:hypothetical protein FIBSPDRAFT_963487 [Athelia psychrophila]|uniref:Uncharacterized protein n=1 Tax=Athelia psychrophila TaxID=1759441 RepID=A0A165YX90_9AGAM|nr:hypothetical protein FIBSPDRAFT_963487 [Fibularhizoctonia sp. CBS 109695]